jgi:hypothetical protein
MADDHEQEQPADDEAYEPPAVEPIGPAKELAKGNEGSATDTD